MTRSYVALLVLALGASHGCRRAEVVSLPGDTVVLAQVNATPISQYDLEQAARTLPGHPTLDSMRDDAKHQLLEGLVRERALAQKRAAELTELERAQLDRKLAIYRQQLLAQQYVDKHAEREPLSNELIQRFYEQNRARFGAEKVRTYELITSARVLAEAERLPLMTALREPSQHRDWRAWSAELQKQRLPVVYERGTTQQPVAQPSLRELVAQLSVGESSRLTFIDGRPYLVRIAEEKELQAMPLAAVRGEISALLRAEQAKAWVRQVSEPVMKDARVVYR